MNTERILPKIIFVTWRDKLILKPWKLGILEQGMNSPDENKLYFTKNCQIENEHFVILVLEVFKSWKNRREIRNFDSRNFREEEWSKIILTMSNLHAVDNYFTFPVNQRYFLFTREPGGLLSQRLKFAATYMGYTTSTVMDKHVNGPSHSQTLKIQWYLSNEIYISTCSIQGISLLREIFRCDASAGKHVTESGDRDHNQPWAKMAKIPNSISNFQF